MCTKNPVHGLVRREIDEPLDARLVLDEVALTHGVADEQETGIQRVAGEQQRGVAIVERDVRVLVAGDAEHVEHALAEGEGH